ncbi:hypothetical protein [Butyrivibrio sp. JL13D10]|uniref:hypothetical protein n=1 Tax=Butyrivibrio sp. JL13D10 TaxID=3236815 RepID=UPI0038B5ACA3
MQYRGKSLDVSYECVFEFRTSSYEYTFPLYGNMTVTGIKTRSALHYEYGYMNGELWRFEDKNAPKKSEAKKTTEKKTENTGSSSSGTYKKSSKSTYDPYDAKKYNSAQDFADDKYEEFYDYEDDYEDEDEAYDAAEDYWNEF